VLSFLIETSLYFSCSIYDDSFGDFMRNQVLEYLMNSSLFDVWV